MPTYNCELSGVASLFSSIHIRTIRIKTPQYQHVRLQLQRQVTKPVVSLTSTPFSIKSTIPPSRRLKKPLCISFRGGIRFSSCTLHLLALWWNSSLRVGTVRNVVSNPHYRHAIYLAFQKKNPFSNAPQFDFSFIKKRRIENERKILERLVRFGAMPKYDASTDRNNLFIRK